MMFVCQCLDNSSPLKLIMIGQFSRDDIGCKTRVKFVDIHSVSSERFRSVWSY